MFFLYIFFIENFYSSERVLIFLIDHVGWFSQGTCPHSRIHSPDIFSCLFMLTTSYTKTLHTQIFCIRFHHILTNKHSGHLNSWMSDSIRVKSPQCPCSDGNGMGGRKFHRPLTLHPLQNTARAPLNSRVEVYCRQYVTKQGGLEI